MILYEAISTYHLLNVIVDKLNKPKHKAILLLSTEIPKKFPDYKKLKKYFDKIVLYDFNYANFHSDDETIEYFNTLLSIRDTQIPYKEIYCSCGHHSFGYFLAISKIPFIFCEDGAGLLSRPEILIRINNNVEIRKKLNKKCEELGLYDGSNENIIRKRGNLKAQVSYFDSKNVEDFDVVKELCKLPLEIRKEIISFFTKYDNIHIPQHATILLTQHFANLRILSFEDQILIYQMFVDYFLPGKNLVIKPHPDDLMYYSQIFPDAQIIREKFPSEFIPFLFDNQPDCLATISSTAIYNLRGHCSEIIELDTQYEKDFYMTHRYYISMAIAEKIGLKLACVGTNDLLVENINRIIPNQLEVKFFKNISEICHPYALLIDDITLQEEDGRLAVRNALKKLDDESYAIFVNSKDDYCWYDYYERELWQYVFPIVIEKEENGNHLEDFYANTDKEVIYIYTKNQHIRDLVKEMKIEKNLQYTGIKIKKDILSQQEERIKMLEGILAATEKRLLYYIEKEKNKK